MILQPKSMKTIVIERRNVVIVTSTSMLFVSKSIFALSPTQAKIKPQLIFVLQRNFVLIHSIKTIN